MTDKIISILLTFFIFVIVNQAGANDVKSTKNTANQDTIIKMDGNRAGLQKKMEPAEEPATSLKKLKPGFQSAIAYSVANHGPITGSRTKLRVNFLRVLEQKKRLHLSDSLHKVIYSYEFFQDPRRDRSLRFRATDDTHSPDSTFDRPLQIGFSIRMEKNILRTARSNQHSSFFSRRGKKSSTKYLWDFAFLLERKTHTRLQR